MNRTLNWPRFTWLWTKEKLKKEIDTKTTECLNYDLRVLRSYSTGLRIKFERRISYPLWPRLRGSIVPEATRCGMWLKRSIWGRTFFVCSNQRPMKWKDRTRVKMKGAAREPRWFRVSSSMNCCLHLWDGISSDSISVRRDHCYLFF